MAENFDHIDQIIRQKFENFGPEPPVSAWEHIRTQISQDPPKGSPGFMMPIIIAVSLLMFISGLVYHFRGTTIPVLPGTAEMTASLYNTADDISTGSTTITDQTIQTAYYQETGQAKVETAFSQARPATAPVTVREPFQSAPPTGKKKTTGSVMQTALGKYVAEKGGGGGGGGGGG